jgi:hypothetical protein
MKHFSVVFMVLANLLTAGCSFLKYDARTAIQPADVHNSQHIDELSMGSPESNEVNYVALAGRFKTKLQKASDADSSEDDIREYLDTGITVVDLYCREFFKQVSESQAHRQFLRAGTNQTGGLISAIMGLAKADAGATGGVGALFSFLDSSIESYDSAYLVAPDLPTVQKLVFQTQSQLSIELTSSDSVYSYPQAERALAMYASNCTFNGIRSLLNSSISTTTTAVEKTENRVTGLKIN